MDYNETYKKIYWESKAFDLYLSFCKSEIN